LRTYRLWWKNGSKFLSIELVGFENSLEGERKVQN
jgi:hypothetical protein